MATFGLSQSLLRPQIDIEILVYCVAFSGKINVNERVR
jgi:hypothetical protein